MKDFKIKFTKGKTELELEAGTIETPEEWSFVKNILNSFDVKTGDIEIEAKHFEEKEEKLKELAEGYNVLSVKEKGLHRPVSEFEGTSMMAVAYKKAQEKKQQNSPQESTSNSFKNSPGTVRFYDGIAHYQCYYICPKCGDKNKHFILPEIKTISCKNDGCDQEMEVQDATETGFPHEDIYRNVFIAGSFVRVKSALPQGENSNPAV